MTAKVITAVLLICACTPTPDSGNNQIQETGCPLTPGKYQVQSAKYNSDTSHYSLLLTGAPVCFKQPFKIKALKLAQLNKDSELAAELEFFTYANSTLNMRQNFPIDLTQTLTGDDGRAYTQSSSWSPFMSGLAGAAAGSMIGGLVANKIFSKPNYYTPPKLKPGQTSVSGFSRPSTRLQGNLESQQKNSKNISKDSILKKQPSTNNTPRANSEKRSRKAPKFFRKRPRFPRKVRFKRFRRR